MDTIEAVVSKIFEEDNPPNLRCITTNKEWEEFLNPKTVNFKNPDTGDVKSVSVNDADAFSKVPEFKNYVRQDG